MQDDRCGDRQSFGCCCACCLRASARVVVVRRARAPARRSRERFRASQSVGDTIAQLDAGARRAAPISGARRQSPARGAAQVSALPVVDSEHKLIGTFSVTNLLSLVCAWRWGCGCMSTRSLTRRALQQWRDDVDMADALSQARAAMSSACRARALSARGGRAVGRRLSQAL